MSGLQVAECPTAYDVRRAVQSPFEASFDLLATAKQGIRGLRALILSLATSGKLLVQNTDDEPASYLLGVLRAEWIRRGEAGSKRRIGSEIQVDARDFTPSGWQYVRLGRTLDMFNGRAFKPTEWQSQGMPIVRIQNLNNAGASFNYCDPTTVQPQHTISKDAFLISWSGTPGTSFGAFIWPGETAALNQHIFKCEQVALVYLPAFLRLAINSQLDVLISQAHGGVGLQHVTKGTLESLSLPLPPLAEQARIVARVEELMQLCDALEAHGRLQDEQHARLVTTLFDALAASDSAHALAENWQRIAAHFDLLLDRPEAVDTLEQTILQLAVRGLLVPQNATEEPAADLMKRITTWMDAAVQEKRIRAPRKPLPKVDLNNAPYTLPKGWVWTRLGKVIYIRSGDGLTAAHMRSGSVPVFGGNGINGYHDEQNVHEPTLVIGRVGYYCGSIHITPAAAWVTDNAFITHFCAKAFSLRFLTLLLQATNLKENENATAQPVISGSKIYPIVVGLPPLSEQYRIVAQVEQLRRLCADLRERLQQARVTQSQLADALVSAAAQSPPC